MNNIHKIAIYLLAFIVITGCTANFEDYNTNPYEPGKLSASNLLPTMFESFASPQQNSCQQNNTMWACFSGHVTAPQTWGRGNNTFAYFNATEEFNEGTVNDFFGKIYSNLFRIEEITEKRGVIYSIAQLTRVHAMHMIASMQGPLPYSKVESGKTSVEYDSEEVAWHAMFEDLNEAIITLKVAAEQGINNELADVDQFYKGDCAKWLKFANTLKLRMAIRISSVEADFARQMAMEAVRDGVMDNVQDSAYDWTNSGQSNNGYSIIDNWGEVRANATLVSYMNGYNDPRRDAYFTVQKVTEDGGYVGVRSGTQKTPSPSTYTNYSRLKIATDASMAQPVMYAAEAAFLRAEGALLGWESEMQGTAKDFYEQGVRLAFEEFKVDGADAYLSNSSLKPGNHDDILNPNDNYTNKSDITIAWNDSDSYERKLERIITQKWIALYLNPLEGWSDFRRTGYPKIFPPTSSASQDGVTIARQQRRLHFAQKEYNNNKANTEAAAAFLSNGNDSDNTDLWWALKN